MSVAKTILNSYWDGFLPVNLNSISKNIGISIISEKQENYCSKAYIKNSKYYINYNSLENELRVRFAIAHSLGHICLNHLKEKDCWIDTSENFSLNSLKTEERQANNFAISLLIPLNILEYIIIQKNITKLETLCEVFNISQVAMAQQLKKLIKS